MGRRGAITRSFDTAAGAGIRPANRRFSLWRLLTGARRWTADGRRTRF